MQVPFIREFNDKSYLLGPVARACPAEIPFAELMSGVVRSIPCGVSMPLYPVHQLRMYPLMVTMNQQACLCLWQGRSGTASDWHN